MQSKNSIISALLQKYSPEQLTDILLVIKTLSDYRMLTPQKLKWLMNTLKELNVDSIDVKKSFTVSISKNIDSHSVVSAVEDKFSNASVNTSLVDSDDDIMVVISGEWMSYKRSLDQDLDLIFKN